MLILDRFIRISFLCGSAPLREAFVTIIMLLALAASSQAQNWDRFRGPDGAGQGEGSSIPVEFSPANFLWRRPLPGIGHSSPVVWGSQVFVTAGDRESAEQVVAAFDVQSGKPMWERRLAGQPYPIHAQSSFASNTPAVDANRVYHLWRTGNTAWIIALTHTGEEVWRREMSVASDENGFGVSPIVMEGVVIVAVENETGESSITGLDAARGEVRWKIPRPLGKAPYCTPCALELPGGKKVFVAASTAAGLSAYDPSNGKLVWQAIEKELPQRIVGSPIAAGGLVITSCGILGNGLVTIAVRADGVNYPLKEAYRIKENVPYVPTPVVAGNLLFLWNDRGTVSCHDLATGEQHWRQRVGGNFNCSPLHIGGRIYCISMEGEVVVLAADQSYRLLGRSSIGEPTSATPAVAHGRLFVRTESSLMCIGEAAGAN